jgi:flagellar biosynthesis protein FlhA
MRNAGIRFVCRTVGLTVENNRSVFTRGYSAGEQVRIPVAHHDGNYFADAETLAKIEGNGQVVFRYAEGTNPNGSMNNIAGVINEKEARRRRDEITAEADFYGAMDGASKFIRGDAIAGIVITIINILGGVAIGMFQEGMTFRESAQIYTVLTIGDGLISQIPALIISSAAGLLVTRVNNNDGVPLPQQFADQLLGSPRALGLLAGTLVGFVALPGFRIPFAVMAAGAAYLAYRGNEKQKKIATAPPTPAIESSVQTADEAPVETLLKVEPLAIELGVDLIALVDERKGGNLVERIQRIRRQTAQEQGLLVPSVHLRDNLKLQPGEYNILLRGEKVAEGTLYPRQFLAINPGDVTVPLKGVKGKDPVFGLDATWINEGAKMNAQTAGYTVVDTATVITTHTVPTNACATTMAVSEESCSSPSCAVTSALPTAIV